jgi:hypothetical protein
MKVLLVHGWHDGRLLLWPRLGRSPAPHAFVRVDASRLQHRDGRTHFHAVYALDPAAGPRATRTATYVGLRERR